MDTQQPIPQGQAAIGGMSAIKQALERRGLGLPTPQLNQVSSTAPSASSTPPPQPQANNSAMPMNAPAQINPAIQHPETKIIVQALTNRLKSLTNQGH